MHQIGWGVLSFIVSVFITVAIFVMSYCLNKKAEKRERARNTGVWGNECFAKIDAAVQRKIKVEGVKCPPQTYEYISGKQEVRDCVFGILNQYEAVGLGYRLDVIDKKVICELRRDAIIETWKLYKDFINEYRKREDKKNVWSEFAEMAKEMANT